ncbi:bolA-like protein 3 [Maniola jurtina]|uniref:bolA-like protein 3 n=1 Tax=Maniola jurtina TaxID=191418 RepID=UPI001E68EAF9|nr:bolA-like protein 3 [Maniola jurtina]
MFRHFIKVFAPYRDKLSRAVGGNGTAFEKNSVSKEQQLTEVLKKSLPGITYVSVQDISGGCGAMFEISIEAKEFVGLSTVKQHRLVTNTLKTEIAEMHGIRIHTTPAPSDDH